MALDLVLDNNQQFDSSIPTLVHDVSGATLESLKKENIIGITGAGIRLILDNWNTYRIHEWIRTLFIVPAIKLPQKSPNILNDYTTILPQQVDAIAALYDALLAKRSEQQTPKVSASFTEKLRWGMENVESLKDLTTEMVLNWLTDGIKKVNFDNE